MAVSEGLRSSVDCLPFAYALAFTRFRIERWDTCIVSITVHEARIRVRFIDASQPLSALTSFRVQTLSHDASRHRCLLDCTAKLRSHIQSYERSHPSLGTTANTSARRARYGQRDGDSLQQVVLRDLTPGIRRYYRERRF